MSGPGISVVVPAYNEQTAIAATVRALRDWLEAHGEPWEILVVDNASEDRTAEVVAELADGVHVRLLRNERNRGKGHSMRRGLRHLAAVAAAHARARAGPRRGGGLAPGGGRTGRTPPAASPPHRRPQ